MVVLVGEGGGPVTVDQGAAGVDPWPVAVSGMQTDGLTDLELRAAPVPVSDDLATPEHGAAQTGADAVLTFTLSAASMVLVDVDPSDLADTDAYVARATVDGTSPTLSVGFACRAGTTTYLPVVTSGTVKVWAPVGVSVAVHGLSR